MRPLGLVLFGILGAACGGGGGNTDGIPDECNPLGGQGCRMPWPSSTYLAADTTSATGFRLAIPREAMPVSGDGTVIEPTWMNRWDGFSPTGPMLAAFPTGVSGAGLPPFSDPDKSLAADSPIILLDMDTGERAPFFAEIDQNEPDAPSRDLVIRPLARLHEKAHYVVAITNKVKADGGGELPVPAAFAALRDGGSFSHPRFADMQKRYADIFAALATAGVDKSALVLAWDFQTASDEFLRSDMTAMRAAALPAMGANGASLSFTAMELGNTALTLKRYIGTYKSPGFLSDKEQDDSIIVRDGTGAPALQGLRDAQFAAIIPACAATHALPIPAIVFGHGLFGSAKSYLDDGFVQTLANEKCFVIIAGDFIGLTERQLQLAPLAVNDMNRAPQITEKLGQSIGRLHGARDADAHQDGHRAGVPDRGCARDRRDEGVLRRRLARRDHGQHVHGVRSEHHARRARRARRRVVDAVRAGRTRGACCRARPRAATPIPPTTSSTSRSSA